MAQKQGAPPQHGSRRSLLLGISAASAPNPASADQSSPSPNGSPNAANECECCEDDWCGCETCSDCHSFLKAAGYEVPLDAPAAYALAGSTGWPAVLNWRSARMPLWKPVADEKLQVQNSTLEGAGEGLFAAANLLVGSVMPPYQGSMLTYAESLRAGEGGAYVWCPNGPGLEMMNMSAEQVRNGPKARQMSFCVDAKPAVEQNPSRYINSAGSKEECDKVNTEICEIGQVMYYRAIRPIPRGAEIVTDYGSNYWEGLEEGC